jgi:hypothetical protein
MLLLRWPSEGDLKRSRGRLGVLGKIVFPAKGWWLLNPQDNLKACRETGSMAKYVKKYDMILNLQYMIWFLKLSLQ